MQDSSRPIPLRTIQERIGHALTESFTLDVYGGQPEWSANEEATTKLGSEIAKAVQFAEANNSQNSGSLTTISGLQNEKDSQSRELEVFANQENVIGCGGWI
jgi:hypothetical protein